MCFLAAAGGISLYLFGGHNRWLTIGLIGLFGMLSLPVYGLSVAHAKDMMEGFAHLGYPAYFANLLGVAKLLGVCALVAPRFVRLKEWAYAGIFFVMTGAVISHIASNDVSVQIIAPAVLAVFTVLSWYLRPADRKIVLVNQ